MAIVASRAGRRVGESPPGSALRALAIAAAILGAYVAIVDWTRLVTLASRLSAH